MRAGRIKVWTELLMMLMLPVELLVEELLGELLLLEALLLLEVELFAGESEQKVEAHLKHNLTVEFMAKQLEQVTLFAHAATVESVAEVGSMHPVQVALMLFFK